MVDVAIARVLAVVTVGALTLGVACSLSPASVDGDALGSRGEPTARLARDGGGEDGAPPDATSPTDAGPCPPGDEAACGRVVFVTSAAFAGNSLENLTGADAKCSAAASTSTSPAVKGRTFKAWLSTTATAAIERLEHGTAPYRKPGGAVVAKDWADLVDGSLTAPIDEDEHGAKVVGKVWTGTTVAGAKGPKQCDEWGPTGRAGRAGDVGQTGEGWTSKSDEPCASALRLYCIEQ